MTVLKHKSKLNVQYMKVSFKSLKLTIGERLWKFHNKITYLSMSIILSIKCINNKISLKQLKGSMSSWNRLKYSFLSKIIFIKVWKCLDFCNVIINLISYCSKNQFFKIYVWNYLNQNKILPIFIIFPFFV